MANLLTGARLGPCEILAPLGAGGMGEVYRARDNRLDRTVAIKVLPPAFAADPQFCERFDREAKTIFQLDHPNICAVYDVGRDLCFLEAGLPHAPRNTLVAIEVGANAASLDRGAPHPLIKPTHQSPSC